jgi:endonuclease/exonuclease/phosphatase family metal-dependent hydrolase
MMSVLTRRRGRAGLLAVVVAVAACVTASSTAQAEPYQLPAPGPSELHVMSYNLRFAGRVPPNSWAQRRPAMKRLFELERPHLIGTQEGRFRQLMDIEADQGGRYRSIGMGREGGSRGEFVSIFYDWRRLLPLQYDHYWLSDHPDLMGSKTWEGCCPRMVTWVRFRDRVTRKQFYAVNTHFEAYSVSTRVMEARMLVRRVAADLNTDLPVVVTGDFNAAAVRGRAVYDRLVTNGPFVDTWVTARQRGPTWGTFNNYRAPTLNGVRIDWVLTTPRVVTRAAKINTFQLDGQYPSDHLPVQALIRLP